MPAFEPPLPSLDELADLITIPPEPDIKKAKPPTLREVKAARERRDLQELLPFPEDEGVSEGPSNVTFVQFGQKS